MQFKPPGWSCASDHGTEYNDWCLGPFNDAPDDHSDYTLSGRFNDSWDSACWNCTSYELRSLYQQPLRYCVDDHGHPDIRSCTGYNAGFKSLELAVAHGMSVAYQYYLDHHDDFDEWPGILDYTFGQACSHRDSACGNDLFCCCFVYITGYYVLRHQQ